MILTAERLREVLHYWPETGIWTWRVRMGQRGQIGAVAGSINGKGYRQIKIDGCVYRANRLAVFYIKGGWPIDEVDHENLDKADDRWLNLRPATKSQNNANRPAQANNAIGLKGASRAKREKKWRAQIKIDGRVIYLGLFDTPEAAHFAYIIAADKAFGQFARAA
jgi:hypothetical protein